MISVEEFITRLRETIASEGSQLAFAKKHEISPAYLNEMLKGKRAPSTKVLDAVGFEAVTMYRKK